MREIETTIAEADLALPEHQEAVLRLVDAYAADPMGDGKPLTESARSNLIRGLAKHPTTIILLAWRGSEPAGIAVCFLGFSTFAARPLLNIHDIFVTLPHRGIGIARVLLAAVEKRARDLGCCKLTLEVLEKNARARSIYEAAGFGTPAGPGVSTGTHFLGKVL
jgi:GNAT superfamily N-acetyltransferase